MYLLTLYFSLLSPCLSSFTLSSREIAHSIAAHPMRAAPHHRCLYRAKQSITSPKGPHTDPGFNRCSFRDALKPLGCLVQMPQRTHCHCRRFARQWNTHLCCWLDTQCMHHSPEPHNQTSDDVQLLSTSMQLYCVQSPYC